MQKATAIFYGFPIEKYQAPPECENITLLGAGTNEAILLKEGETTFGINNLSLGRTEDDVKKTTGLDVAWSNDSYYIGFFAYFVDELDKPMKLERVLTKAPVFSNTEAMTRLGFFQKQLNLPAGEFYLLPQDRGGLL